MKFFLVCTNSPNLCPTISGFILRVNVVDLLDQIGFVFLMLNFFKRLLSIKGVFHLDLDIFASYLQYC